MQKIRAQAAKEIVLTCIELFLNSEIFKKAKMNLKHGSSINESIKNLDDDFFCFSIKNI